MSISKELPCLKNQITKDDEEKILKIFKVLEDDCQAYAFLEPVNYVELNLLDYPTIIKNPMDLGTAKQNLIDGKYKTFKDFIADIDLIWSNCRTYNISTSDICKMANHCEKLFKKQMEKTFKNYNTFNKISSNKESNITNNNKKENELSTNQKLNISDKIKTLSNEGITKVVEFIKRECPNGIEDIDNEKLQIKLDCIDNKYYKPIIEIMDNSPKIQTKSEDKDKDKDTKSPVKEQTQI